MLSLHTKTHLESISPGRGTLLRWAGWFFLANSAVVLLVSLRYLSVAQIPEGEYAFLFSVLAFIGHFASLGFIGALLLFLPILILPWRRLIFLLGITLGSLYVLGIVIDIFVFSQYRFHLNGMVLNLLLGGAAEEIFTFSGVLWMWVALFVAAVILFEWWLARRIWRFVLTTPGKRYGYLVTTVLFGVFLAGNVMHAWADANSYTPITRQARILPAYQPLTARDWFIEHGWADPDAVQQRYRIGRATGLDYPRSPLQCEPPDRLLNILYIVVDSWRFDTMTERATPNIHRLARQSLVFENHYSGANSTRTGIFSLFYGIPGTYWHAMLAEQRGAVFIEQLLRQDYRLGIFASAKLFSPEFDRTVFVEVENLRLRSKGSSPRERDRNITEEFLDFLDGTEQPFFGFLFYDSPHGYDFPPDYPLVFQPSWKAVNYLLLDNDFDPAPFFNRYRNSVHFVDSLVGQVLDRLAVKGLLESTVVVITGDHGQEFNDNRLNYWGHNGNFSPWQTRVPLVIHWPGREPQRISRRTSHFDIAPTLMQELLGCRNDMRDYSSGKHLIDGPPGSYLLLSSYGQFAVMEEQRITVVDELGHVDILGPDYRPLPGARLSPELMRSVMEEMSRFYAR